MRRVRTWAWLVLGICLFLPEVCWARVPTRLVYARSQSAKDCPDEPKLVQAVAARLGYDPFSPWGDQTIFASVSRAGSSVVGHAELIDHDGIAQGSREVKLPSADCGELILALALAISITLDPLHVAVPAPLSEPPSVAVAEPPAPDPEPVPAPTMVAPPRDVPRQRSTKSQTRSSWHATAGALTTYSLASPVAFGARLGVEARRAQLSVALEAWTAMPTAWDLEGGGRLRASLWAGAIAPCLELLTGFRLCGFGSVGSLRSESFGIASPRSERVVHAAVGGRASFSWPFGRTLALTASADVAGVLNRPRFQLDGVEVWRPSPALAVLGIGASARFF